LNLDPKLQSLSTGQNLHHQVGMSLKEKKQTLNNQPQGALQEPHGYQLLNCQRTRKSLS